MIIGSTRSSKLPEEMKIKPGAAIDPRFIPTVPDGATPFGVVERGNDAFIQQGNDISKLHLILDMQRIGGNLFCVKLEYTYFPPRSGRNKLFDMALLQWPNGDFALKWAVLSFPLEYRPQAEALAKECGLRIADGVPHVFDAAGAHCFPLDGETVFTLENIHNHQTYANDPANYERLREEEFAATDAIFQADRVKLKQEFRDKGYADAQIDRILEHWDNGDEAYEEKPIQIRDGAHKHGTN